VKVIKTVVGAEGGRANRKDTEGNVYLPIHMGYRNCYYRYMESLGYRVTVGPNGTLTVKEDTTSSANNDEEDEHDYITFPTYWSKWKMLYPHMKVSRPAEDICGYCYTFANRHRILSSRQSAMLQQQHHHQEQEQEQERETTTALASGCDGEDEMESNAMLNSVALDAPGAACTEIEDAKENLIQECAIHIDMARAQRFLYQKLEEAAVCDAKDAVNHSKRRYTLTCDFGKNMQCPCYNSKQPGCTYYYTPLNVFNFGIVDHSHDYGNGTIGNHMYCHVYHEGIGKKGGTNVASLIVKTLRGMNILKDGDPGGELNIIFDNCTGQNKNNTVLKLAIWLKEMGYFTQVNFVFLVVGHTKNACDRLFNSLKHTYRQRNIYTMDELLEALSVSRKITVIRTEPGDFSDYDALFKVAYNDLKGLLTKNHIFTCGIVNDGDELWMSIRESDLEDCAVTKHIATKQGRQSRANLEALMNQYLRPINPPGINAYKVVELYTKYRPVVPEDYWEDELYLKPPDEVLKKFKEEKVIRKDNREKVKSIKEGRSKNEGVDYEIMGEIKKMNVTKLKVALKSHGLAVDGLKGVLQARLNTHLRIRQESSSGGMATLDPSNEPTNTQGSAPLPSS
jgi:hypothetical protein